MPIVALLTTLAWLSGGVLPTGEHGPQPPSYVSQAEQQPAFELNNAGQNVALISRMGGSTLAVAVRGDIVYIGVGSEFAVVDVSDRTRPRKLGLWSYKGLSRALT